MTILVFFGNLKIMCILIELSAPTKWIYRNIKRRDSFCLI